MSGGRLPAGWALARIADVTEVVRNAIPEKEPDRMFAYVDISSIDNVMSAIADLKRFRGADAPSRARRPIRPNDVLFSNVRTYLRNIALVPKGLRADLCSTGFTVLRPTEAILPRYLLRFVLSDEFIDRVTPKQTGTHYPATSERVVRGESIRVPPLLEQMRIAATLEALLARGDANRQRLVRVKELLRQLRQSVLSAAFSGRLTADWRAGAGPLHPTRPAPPDSRHARRRGANRSGPADLLIDGMPEIPSSWRYVRHDWLAAPGTVITYGIVLPGPEVHNGVAYVRQQDIQDGWIRTDELRHTTKAIAAKHPRSTLAEGDVLLCIIRNLRVAVVPAGLDGANITQGSVRTRPDPRYVDSEYLALYLASQSAQRWMQQRYFGMDMPRINVEDARAIPIALPPMREQLEIVRRVNALLTLTQSAGRRVDDTVRAVEQLTKSVVLKAFRGELVPTEAELAAREGRDFEPATALLKRLSAPGHPTGSRDRPVEPRRAASNRDKGTAARSPAGRRGSKRG